MTDKAVSTEDLCIDVPRNASLEAARLEAVIKTLIENKVESIKNTKRKSSSITSSPKSIFNKLKGNSTSTVSSKEKDEVVLSPIRRQITEPKKPPKKFPEKTLQFSDEDCSEGCYCRKDLNDIQIQVDDDFISLNIEDFDSLNQIEVTTMGIDKHTQRKKRRKRKKHRKNKKNNNNRLKVASMAVQMKMNDHLKDLDEDELSKRARLTIILTACLLLFMCLLLVGITLRMAPLIDDMESITLKNHFDVQQRRTSVLSARRRSRKLSLQEIAVEKKRKQMVYIVVGIFVFILFSCVLVVIVTLTMTHHTDDVTGSNITVSKNFSSS